MKKSKTREEMLMGLLGRKTQRAVNLEHGACTYLHSYNGGCAIGCEVTEAKALELQGSGDGLDALFDRLPVRLKKMTKAFLLHMQDLHDREFYWIGGEILKGLNEHGRLRVNAMISEFDLDIPTFKFITP